MTARRERGRESEDIVAELYREYGAVQAERVAKFLSGRDIKNVPNIAPEVKSAVGFDVLAWLRQAKKNSLAGDIPVVHYRPRGYGKTKIDEWPVILRTEDFMLLLVMAGYLPGKVKDDQ